MRGRHMKKAFMTVVAAVVAALFAGHELSHAQGQAQAQSKRLNIFIILGDDMGFADLGSFGSEIRTPNLDSPANEGVRFTN